jgi:geranylgeranyl diphosphate synthase type I
LRDAYGDARRGAASALLASDLAWGLAMRIMAELDAAPSRRVAAMSALLRCHQEVIVGQQLDLLTEHHAGAVVAEVALRASVETVHRLKTASYTVTAPLLVGACLAGAEQGLQDELELFARPLGIAFQLRDDLKGVFGDPAETGKGRAGDLRAGKRTAVTEAAAERLDEAGQRALEAVLGVRDASAEALGRAVAELERCGVRVRVEEQLTARCALARERLAAISLPERTRSWLTGAIDRVQTPTERP